MTHIEYTKRLYIILHNYDEITTISQTIAAILALNNEAIGKDERKSYAGHERLAAKQRNHIRQELRNILGASNE